METNGYFKRKTGAVEARLVAQGFSQRHGLDYDETFIRFESISIQKGLKLLPQWSSRRGSIYEAAVIMDGKEHLVCRLKHSLYGLKQSPVTMSLTLISGFVQSVNDPCIYTAGSL